MRRVRFICGTQDIHKTLEKKLADFFHTDDTILYSSCFDANGGVFEPLFGEDDAIITDALNHASIIDGIRLCKATRYVYKNNDMADLEAKLAGGARPPAADRSDRHRRRLLHGRHRRPDSTRSATWPTSTTPWSWSTTPTPPASSARPAAARTEYCGVMGKVDIVTGTLGKALGGALGRLHHRPQGDHRAAAAAQPAVPVPQHGGPVDRREASIAVSTCSPRRTELRDKVEANTKRFRERMTDAGFDIKPGDAPDRARSCCTTRSSSQDIAATCRRRASS